MFRKLTAAAVTALLALAGVALVAAPASAHTSKVTGVATCEADGTYSVLWTYNATNVPKGVEAETKAMHSNPGQLAVEDGVLKGGQVFLSVWSDHQINVPGAPVRTGNWTAQFNSTGIPGTSTSVSTMVQTDWKGGPSEDPVGTVKLDGTCKPPVIVPEKPAPVVESVPVDTLNCDTRTVTTVTTTTTTDWKLVDNAWVKDTPVVTTATTTREATPQECPPPPPAPAQPKADIAATCGLATVTLANGIRDGITASFVVNVDGEVFNAYSVAAGEQPLVVEIPFGEDTGTHDVEVFQAGTSEWKSIASATVESDCQESPVVTPPTKEPPVAEPPAVQPPAQAAPPAARASVPSEAVLATTGGPNPLPLLAGGALAALAGLAVLLVARHRARVQ